MARSSLSGLRASLRGGVPDIASVCGGFLGGVYRHIRETSCRASFRAPCKPNVGGQRGVPFPATGGRLPVEPRVHKGFPNLILRAIQVPPSKEPAKAPRVRVYQIWHSSLLAVVGRTEEWRLLPNRSGLTREACYEG